MKCNECKAYSLAQFVADDGHSDRCASWTLGADGARRVESECDCSVSLARVALSTLPADEGQGCKEEQPSEGIDADFLRWALMGYWVEWDEDESTFRIRNLWKRVDNMNNQNPMIVSVNPGRLRSTCDTAEDVDRWIFENPVGAPPTPPPAPLCVKCGRPVEDARKCYAIPTCYACLPPPEPLPVCRTAGSTPQPAGETGERRPSCIGGKCQTCGHVRLHSDMNEREIEELEIGNTVSCQTCGQMETWDRLYDEDTVIGLRMRIDRLQTAVEEITGIRALAAQGKGGKS